MTEDNKPKFKLKLSSSIDMQKLRQDYLASQAKGNKKADSIKSESEKSTSFSTKFTDEEVKQRLELLKRASEIEREKLSAVVKTHQEETITFDEPQDPDVVAIAPLPAQGHDPAPFNDAGILPSAITAAILKDDDIALSPEELRQTQTEKTSKSLKDLKDRQAEPKKLSTAELVQLEVTGDVANQIKFRSQAAIKRTKNKQKRQSSSSANTRIAREVAIGESIRVGELANLMAEKSSDVIRELAKLGLPGNISQVIDADTAELLVSSFGHQIKHVRAVGIESILQNQVDDPAALMPRPPVVTVMGHVDHGKTSLLDALRSSNMASKEAGGITQHIGAYSTTLADGRSITFIDTPGHEAFTAMRSRGAKVTDIVVLVVAADDGIRPQTIEAINHAKAANAPIIVAINKIDKPDADIRKVKNELLHHNVVAEDFGGEVMMIPVSAIKGDNLKLLQESILLLAELLELKANPKALASGVVIESRIDKFRGIVVTLLVQRGCLNIGDIVVAGSTYGRIRAMTDDNMKTLKRATPSTPIETLGFTGVPGAGDKFAVVNSDKEAKELAQTYREASLKQQRPTTAPISAQEAFMHSLSAEKKAKLPVVIKTDTQGSLEAIVSSLHKIEHTEVQLQILHSAVGNISTSDVLLAQASKAIVIGFNVKTAPDALQAAKKNQIRIKEFSVIYNLIDEVKLLLSGLLEPTTREQYLGNVEIRQVFNLTKAGVIAGSYVTKGVVKRGSHARLLRDAATIYEGKIVTLKRFKEDVKEVREGFECGIALSNYNDIQVGDMLEVYEIIKEQQYIS